MKSFHFRCAKAAVAVVAVVATTAIGVMPSVEMFPERALPDREIARPGRPLVGVSVPSHIAAIAAEQSGTIVAMEVRPGNRIKVGDLLFRLSNRLQQLEVERLAALVDSPLERNRAKATLDHAHKKVSRIQTLLEQQISAEAAASDVVLESQLARLSLGKVEFEQQQLRNELLQARERLAQRLLHSPLDGVVTRQFKQLGETADQLEPVVEVMSIDPLWIQFECPVDREAEFPNGGKISVIPAAGGHDARAATIEHVSLQSTVASHTFQIRASLPNPGYLWRSGLKMLIEPDLQAAATPAGK